MRKDFSKSMVGWILYNKITHPAMLKADSMGTIPDWKKLYSKIACYSNASYAEEAVKGATENFYRWQLQLADQKKNGKKLMWECEMGRCHITEYLRQRS